MRLVLGMAAWLVAAGAAMAQQTTLAPSAAVDCLTPPAAERGVPAYPFDAYKRGQTGRVKVQLRFTGAAQAPAVTVLEQLGDDSFVDAVRAHARTLRVPCLQGAKPADLVFDFVFNPNETRLAPQPEDADRALREEMLRCMANLGGSLAPEYPKSALRRGVQGRVLVQLQFHAPDKPPAVWLMPRTGGDADDKAGHPAEVFLPSLREWTAGYRMPCLQGETVTLNQVYIFLVEGSSFGFKPGLGLRELLVVVKGLQNQRLQFDFATMGCPFDVSLDYWRPNLPNTVAERGSVNPMRRPFLDWLRQVELDLPPRTLDAVYGDTLNFTVPCLKIDLNPTGAPS